MQTIPVILLGAGGVGRSLLRQLVAGHDTFAARNGQVFRVVAVADRRHWLADPAGLTEAQLRQLVADKEGNRPIGPARPADILQASGVPHAILVDVTAEAGMEPLIDQALDAGWGVVLANKKPLAGDLATARRYLANPRLRHESTVGGGQPVIATLRYLLDTNDPVTRIEGQLSGTLGYICRRLDEAVPFSQAVAEAKAKGYTEPDPREDLGGLDVMRKVLILGRMAGWEIESADIAVESLTPPALAHLSVPEFMAASVALNPALGDRVAAARANGDVLRYVAELADGKGRVGLKAVPAHSPTANLKYISFHTRHYADEALMICGKGAGVEMTAAGVLGDLIALGREQFAG
jgi:homoserine dehydrogenase